MAIYTFGLVVLSSYVAHTKIDNALKAGYFIVAIALTLFIMFM